MSWWSAWTCGLVVACGGRETAAPSTPGIARATPNVAMVAIDAFVDVPIDAWVDAPIDAQSAAVGAPAMVEAPAVPSGPQVWLKGSTHVHALPSGDSRTPVPSVIRWYETRGYDFIVITDHNQISEVDPTRPTQGVAVQAPIKGLIALAGTELTHNPDDCVPPGDGDKHCRIHVNLLGTTARPGGRIKWANHKTNDRIEKYQAAIDQQVMLGGIAQINHPQWYWGMTSEVLTELARRGMKLVEIANSQFPTWNAGDKDHPSTEALWDAVLAQGLTMWGVASDDAHHYDDQGKYPAGGGWVMVKAQRDPQAILAALGSGRFYASNGVVLQRAEVVAGRLIVEVSAKSPGRHVIEFIENGKRVGRTQARRARRAVPATGYLRAVVTRADGKMAWVQPARSNAQ